jgi:hypothetical protein
MQTSIVQCHLRFQDYIKLSYILKFSNSEIWTPYELITKHVSSFDVSFWTTDNCGINRCANKWHRLSHLLCQNQRPLTTAQLLRPGTWPLQWLLVATPSSWEHLTFLCRVKFGPCTYVEIGCFKERISNVSKQLDSECSWLQEWDESGWMNEIDSPENDTHTHTHTEFQKSHTRWSPF